MENNLEEMFKNFTNIVNELSGKLDGILNAYKEAEDNYNDGVRAKEWKEKYGDRLSKYDHDLKAVNGEDFDIIAESRKEFESDYNDIEADEYVEALVANIEDSITSLKEALNEGNVAEAAHIAEELEKDSNEVAENTEAEAHEEINEEDAFQAELDKAKEEADAEAEFKAKRAEEE